MRGVLWSLLVAVFACAVMAHCDEHVISDARSIAPVSKDLGTGWQDDEELNKIVRSRPGSLTTDVDRNWIGRVPAVTGAQFHPKRFLGKCRIHLSCCPTEEAARRAIEAQRTQTEAVLKPGSYTTPGLGDLVYRNPSGFAFLLLARKNCIMSIEAFGPENRRYYRQLVEKVARATIEKIDKLGKS